LAAVSIPEIVVTPNYTPTPIGEVGSTVTVIGRDVLARSSATTVAQVLRSVPGVAVIESGGPGGSAEVRLRGGETGHTVVLIDGVRVNDPASARGDFDFTLLSTSDIDHIEILRGPQSAIYGSDAMGGVVNIVTRRQTEKSSLTATGEGGSYGTLNERVAGGMRAGDFAVRFSGSHDYATGFSRRGNRDTDEPDGLDRWSGTGKLTYAPLGGVRFDLGGTATHELSGYDATSNANAPNVADRTELSAYAKATLPEWNGWLTQSFQVSGLSSRRVNSEPLAVAPSPKLSTFTATTVGAEYQAIMDLQRAGTLTGGASVQGEIASNVADAGFTGYDSRRTYFAGYLQEALTLAERLHLTFAGRYDGQVGGEGFLTGRATAAYEMPDWGTTLRASIGTGAKRPTAYQVGYNQTAALTYLTANTNLQPERSFGVDAGVDQTLFGGAVHVSATAFYNEFRNLLTFPDNYYDNIDHAEAHGLELSLDTQVWPGMLDFSATYTWMPSRNLITGAPLPRRPEHSGSFTVTWTPEPEWEVAFTGIVVGTRRNTASSATMLPGYWRLDASLSHALSDSVKAFARIENLTNNTYQDPVGYNAAGFSAYVGLTWNK
jgi:vitamin B12 transporter